MTQFYFLSVLMNILAGLILVYGLDLTRSSSVQVESDEDSLPDFDSSSSEQTRGAKASEKLTKDFNGLNGRSLRLVVGALSVIVGIMKILSVYRNDVPVVGDLIPAIAGLLGGMALLLEYFLTTSREDVVLPDFAQKIFIDSRRYLGVFCFVAGVLHFVFPQVLFL